jgi:hypothetical protein
MTSECLQIQDPVSARCIITPHKMKLSDSTKWVVGNASSDMGKRAVARFHFVLTLPRAKFYLNI